MDSLGATETRRSTVDQSGVGRQINQGDSEWNVFGLWQRSNHKAALVANMYRLLLQLVSAHLSHNTLNRGGLTIDSTQELL